MSETVQTSLALPQGSEAIVGKGVVGAIATKVQEKMREALGSIDWRDWTKGLAVEAVKRLVESAVFAVL